MLISRRGLTLSVGFFLWLSIIPTANVPVSSAADPIYKYTDDSSTQNFTTELGSIPEKYRSRVVPLDRESFSAPPPLVSGEQPAPSANVRVVTASGEYRMGDHDTRTDAVRLAVEAAKREALEQVATYLESVTEITNMDVTRDDIRTYTAGIVMVLDQKITTRLEGDTVVIQADLTAQVDPNEVAQAITALRENESAKNELVALRSETDQLRQQLDAANQALATAVSPEQIQDLNQQRQDLLNQLQTNALVSQAWTDWVYVTPVIYPYPWIGVQQVHGLLLQAQHLYPRNRHLPILQQIVTTQAGALPPAPPGVHSPVQPHPSLLVPPPASLRLTPPPPLTLLPGSANAATGAHALRTPAPPQQFSSPLPPTLQQIHPPHVAQPNPPVLRAPYSVPHYNPSMSPRHFGGGGGRHSGGGGHFGGGHHGR
ncbi:MAG: hypothetical protein KGJ48_12870 [Nitrospirota bacterium]|nr:hypothetical protein [Nitrospirota bacterium]MDE3221585.1 hypothetical protein [Nitrospirota bacterium]